MVSINTTIRGLINNYQLSSLLLLVIVNIYLQINDKKQLHHSWKLYNTIYIDDYYIRTPLHSDNLRCHK